MAKIPQPQWPDEHGRSTNIKSIANEKLLVDTQRLVNAQRRRQDDLLYANTVDATEYDPAVSHERSQPLVFEGIIEQMVAECNKRGLALNTDR